MAWQHEDLLKRVQVIAAEKYRTILLKNPSGLGYVGQRLGDTPDGHVVLTNQARIQFGLQMPGKEFGGSDLIGPQPLRIKHGADVFEVARFCAVEIKIGNDTLTPAQQRFLEAVRLNGGACGVVRDDPEQIHQILRLPPWAVA